MQILAKLLMMSILTSLFAACWGAKPEKFASDAPVKKIVFDLPFPGDLIYQASPDAKVIVGKKKIEPAIYEIGAFEIETGKKLWQLPFIGEVIGQTETQILVYEEKTLTVHFINPNDGKITRKVSSAPNPLTSKNSLETGMAFTDEMYLTTKALYTSILENGQADESFKIGITAKTWENKEVKWFVPPVKQIVTIETRPVIFGDKVLIINANYSPQEPHYYQIVSLTTGAEIFRGASEGYFYYLDNKFFIEQTKSFARRIEPLTGKELWRIEYAAQNAGVSAIGNQITVSTNDGKSNRTIRLVDAETGKLLKQFDLPGLPETSLKACFITKDGTALLNFDSKNYDIYDKAHYNYWVAYDADAKKALWRTDFESHSASSLFPFVSNKLQFKDSN